jgi:hypothetical protein
LPARLTCPAAKALGPNGQAMSTVGVFEKQ